MPLPHVLEATAVEGVPLPTLPTELWELILRHVVHIPGMLSFEKEDPFCLEEQESTREEILDAAANMQTLHGVCQAWKSIAHKLNCSAIVVCCAKHLKPIADHLEHSKLADPERRGLGWYTERVHLRMRKLTRRAGEQVGTEGEPNLRAVVAGDLIRLFRCTPNLKIYLNNNIKEVSLGSHGRTHPQIMKTIASACGSSLRRLEWTGEEAPSALDLEALCRASPNLVSILVGHVHPSPPKVIDSPVILPHLHTLSLGRFPHPSGIEPICVDHVLTLFCDFQNDQLPALRRLELYPVDSNETFFTIHGGKVTSLRIGFSRFTTGAGTKLHVLQMCSPKLQTLILDPEGFESAELASVLDSTTPIIFQHLTRIGLFPYCAYIFSSDIHESLEQLFELLDDDNRVALPVLETIRITYLGSMSDVLNSHTWLQRWWRRWNERGVVLQDRKGEALSYGRLVSTA